MTVNSRVIKTFFAWAPDATDVPLMNGLRVQILPTIHDLPRARKYQFAAYVAAESLLVVWDDDPSNVIKRATTIESQLMELVWRTGGAGEDEVGTHEKHGGVDAFMDSESGEAIPDHRATNLMNTILVAFTLVIVVVLLGLACRSLAIEIAVDHSYLRLAFLSLVPVQIFFTLVCGSPVSQSHLAVADNAVLCASHSRLRGSMHRPCPSNATQFEIFLGQAFSATSHRVPSTHYSPVSRVQRRPLLRDCTNRQVHQASHLHLRTPRRHCKHAYQRRRPSAHSR